MAQYKVQRWNAPGFVVISDPAPAVVGRNVYAADGTTLYVPLTAADVQALQPKVSTTLWELVQKIPPNVTALEEAAGTGLFAVTGAATGAFRELQGLASVVVTAGDGVAGDPSLALVGDDPSPDPDAYYGTDASGTKGFFPLPSGADGLTPDQVPTCLAIYLVDSNGDFITEADGTTFVVHLDATDDFWRLFRDREFAGTLALVLDGSGVGYQLTRYSADSVGPQVRLQKARGSEAVPAAVQALDSLFVFQARGYHSGGDFSGSVASLDFLAAEDFTGSAQGTTARLRVTPVGSTTAVSAWEVDSAQAFVPGATNARDLGSSTRVWNTGYVRHLVRSGAMFETGVISVASLAADTHNWNPAGLATCSVIRCGSTGAARTLTGIVAPATGGQRLRLVNITSLDWLLAHDNAGSTAANRLYCPGSATVTLHPHDSVELWYDPTSARWRVLGL